ncbi:MAG: hypothetical protein Q9219_007656 [cf. Caloplaca sp. 3 TL-2023]
MASSSADMGPPLARGPSTRKKSKPDRLIETLSNPDPSTREARVHSPLTRAGPSDPERSPEHAESSDSKRTATTAFSARAIRVIELDGEQCWHCTTTDYLEHAHILGRARTNILKKLQREGKTNLTDIHQAQNGMYLCVGCHRALDDHEDPGWVFVPANLDFFLQLERDDYRRRVQVFSRTGTFPVRIPPTVEAYMETHQGHYNAYILREYGPPNLTCHPGLSRYQSQPKVWHGDPMLGVYKAIKASAQYSLLLPPELAELSALYQAHDMGPPSNAPRWNEQEGDDDQNSAGREDGARSRAAPRGSHGQGSGQGQVLDKVLISQGGRGAGQAHAGWLTKPAFYWRDEPWYHAKRIKVETSPWAYDPQQTSNDQIEDFKVRRTHVQAAGHYTQTERIEHRIVRGVEPPSNTTGLPSPSLEDLTPPHYDEEEHRVCGGLGTEDVVQWLSSSTDLGP